MAAPFSHTRSLRPCVKHFDHPHPLRPVTVTQEEEAICSICELDLFGSSYRCNKAQCSFLIHKSCYELPQKLEHNSHPQHPLFLLPLPPNNISKFTCNACGEYGTSFVYHCGDCQFNLHVGCAFLPETIKHVDHGHKLSLFYSTLLDHTRAPNEVFTCDSCRKEVSKMHWVYYCNDCDYGTDITCTIPEY